MKTKKSPGVVSDLVKSAMPEAVAFVVKSVLDLVPQDSKLEDILKTYKAYWPKLSLVASFIIMRATNLSDIGDDILAAIDAEVSQEISRRYSGDVKTNVAKSDKKGFSISMATAFLSFNDLVKFTELLKSVSEKQRKAVLTHELVDKLTALKLLNNLVLLSEIQFKDWVENNICSSEKTREKTEFEKKVEQKFADGVKSLGEDSKNLFNSENALDRLAKRAMEKINEKNNRFKLKEE